MRKWQWITAVAVLLGCGAVCWQIASKRAGNPVPNTHVSAQPAPTKPITASVPDSDTVDMTEPLIVEGPSFPQTLPVPAGQEPMPRALMQVGMKLPPRPDAEPGNVLRMPYADEDESRSPLRQFVAALLARLNIFQNDDMLSATEESETAEPTPRAEPAPAVDYHRLHPHCPHTGGCPYPYHR